MVATKRSRSRSSEAGSSVPTCDVATLAALFDHLPDVAFFIKDPDGRYQAVNQSLVERCGRTRKEELIGRHVRELFPAELAEAFADEDAAVARTGKPVLDRLELHWRPGRRPGWCLTTKLPLCDAGGAVVGVVGVSRDVRGAEDRQAIPAGLARAVDYLEEHYGTKLTPSRLAGVAGLSPSKFARLIRRVFRVTPVQLIAKTRLAAASHLLRDTDRAVVDIAHACGFYDHSAFTRAFRQATGLTPTEYRRGESSTQLQKA